MSCFMRWCFAIDSSGLGANSKIYNIYYFLQVWLYCYLGGTEFSRHPGYIPFLTTSILSHGFYTIRSLSIVGFSPPQPLPWSKLPVSLAWVPGDLATLYCPCCFLTICSPLRRRDFFQCADVISSPLYSDALISAPLSWVPIALRMLSSLQRGPWATAGLECLPPSPFLFLPWQHSNWPLPTQGFAIFFLPRIFFPPLFTYLLLILQISVSTWLFREDWLKLWW